MHKREENYFAEYYIVAYVDVCVCVYVRNKIKGVPTVAQWLMNLTRNHEVASLVPALAQLVNAPALP